MSTPSVSRFVVDRREGNTLCIQDKNGRNSDVPVGELPRDCRAEGAVLDVPINELGEPIWRQATRNRAEEAILRQEANSRLDRLRRLDPGGDVDL